MLPNITIILILTCIALCVILMTSQNNKESFNSLSNEAVQNIMSVYNNNNLLAAKGTIDNLTSKSLTTTNIIGTTATVSGTISAETVTTPAISSSKICFDPTHCIDSTIFSALMLESKHENQYMYLPSECTIYEDLDSVYGTIFTGTTGASVDTYYTGANNWYGTHIYSINGGQNGNTTGFKINVPKSTVSNKDYTVMWVLTITDRNTTFSIAGPSMSTVNFGSGYRQLNNIAPNGAIHNERWDLFEWIPIPITLDQSRSLSVTQFRCDNGFYIAGLAFSTNPWGHCRISSLMLWWSINILNTTIYAPGPLNTSWGGGWNYDQFIIVNNNLTAQFRIPIVITGKTKVFYIITQNDYWTESIKNVSIVLNDSNSTNITISMSSSFDNPFSRHFNSKKYQRYLGGTIDPKYIDSTGYINVSITAPSNTNIYMREIGTHDYNPFE